MVVLTFSLSASPCLLHYLPHCFCSCLSLFLPIQLLHRLNPDPSSLVFSPFLLSIHSWSYSAESLPGAFLLSAIGGKDRTMKEKRAIAQNGKEVGYKMERWIWRSAGKWLQRKKCIGVNPCWGLGCFSLRRTREVKSFYEYLLFGRAWDVIRKFKKPYLT